MPTKLRSLDVLRLTSQAQEISLACPAKWFGRALKGLPPQDKNQVFQCLLQGEQSASGQRLLHVSLKGAVQLECQRCLEIFSYPVQVENTLVIVEDEDELIEDDDPEAFERLVGSTSFDGFALLEDELILSLPYVARHEQCPELPAALQEQPQGEAPQAKKRNPFQVLEQLKKDLD